MDEQELAVQTCIRNDNDDAIKPRITLLEHDLALEPLSIRQASLRLESNQLTRELAARIEGSQIARDREWNLNFPWGAIG